MPVFSTAKHENAHRAFVDWIDMNSQGFVLNVQGPKDVVLNRATCGHFKPYDWANRANHVKACSTDHEKFEQWAEVEGHERFRLCADCL